MRRVSITIVTGAASGLGAATAELLGDPASVRGQVFQADGGSEAILRSELI